MNQPFRLTLVFEYPSENDAPAVSIKSEFHGGKLVACMFDDARFSNWKPQRRKSNSLRTNPMNLFPSLPESKSPRLRWMERHNITTEQHGADDDGNTWTAFNAFTRDGKPYFTMQSGPTEDDALHALAKAAGLKLWNEEGIV